MFRNVKDQPHATLNHLQHTNNSVMISWVNTPFFLFFWYLKYFFKKNFYLLFPRQLAATPEFCVFIGCFRELKRLGSRLLHHFRFRRKPLPVAVSRLAPQPDDKRSSWENTAAKLGQRGEMSPAEDARGPRWPDGESAAEKSCFTVRQCGWIRPSRSRKTANLLPTLPLFPSASSFSGRNAEKRALGSNTRASVCLVAQRVVSELILNRFKQPSLAS